MHLHRAHPTPATKTRFAIGAAVLILVILASTSSRWLLPFVEFAGSHSTHIEAIAALVQIVLWGGAGVLALVQVWGLRRRQEPAQDLARVAERYLEHLADRYRHLDFRGMGVSDRVPLRLPLLDMYIPLKARVETPEGETWERIRLAGRKPGEEEKAALLRLSAPHPVLDLLRENDGLILLGDPGAGKTTFVKFLALALATGQGEAFGLGTRLPVILPISAYATALAAGDVPLISFIARYYHDRGVELPLEPMLERAFGEGGVLLFLDGLDEVRELERRHLVVERVRDFYCFHRKAGNKFVLTSRIVGYREVRPAAEGLAECTLVDFEEAEIEAFVDRWTAAVERAAGGETRVATLDARRERDELLAAVRRNPGVRSLASNPLLLTILALMKRQGVSLPERRVHLYETYVETLLKHWNLARSLGGRSGRDLDLVETLKILPPLALWMHRTSPGVGLVREGDLVRELEGIYQERRHEDPPGAARHFLEDVREHTALLLDRGGRQYGFIHLTFQEYLAAVALAQKGQREIEAVVDALAQHVGEPTWHEVTLLTIGYLGVIQQRDEAASAVLEELIRRAPGPRGESVVLAGHAVADAGTGGVTPACRKLVVESLLQVLRDTKVETSRRAAAGLALAAIGDPRPEVATVDGLELCPVPAGPCLLGNDDAEERAQDCEKPLHRHEIPYDYRIGRFPVTVAQLREYARAVGKEEELAAALSEPANRPAGSVTWQEARAFCDWLTERWRSAGVLEKGWVVRLPSEAEWVKAARGGLQDNRLPARRFPWGNQIDPSRANQRGSRIGDISAVGCFPAGVSPCGFFLGTYRGFTRQLRTIFAPPPEPPPPARRLLRVLVVADPAADAHLEGAEEEGLEVADLFESYNLIYPESESRVEVVRLFGPREATRTTVLRHLTLRSYDVLHFSGHCLFDADDPDASGWLFSDNTLLSAHELNRIDRIPNFVFSNACESGITPDRSELRNDRLAPSFAEAFFHRGVVNFVCTAWPVDDLAARIFARELYGHLLGISVVESDNGALRYTRMEEGSSPMHKAMQQARMKTAEGFNGVRTWGAYQHYGNPNFQFFASPPPAEEETPSQPPRPRKTAAAKKSRRK